MGLAYNSSLFPQSQNNHHKGVLKTLATIIFYCDVLGMNLDFILSLLHTSSELFWRKDCKTVHKLSGTTNHFSKKEYVA